MNLSDIGGKELNNSEKQLLKGGDEPVLRIWCNSHLVGVGDKMKGWCSLTEVIDCENALYALYPAPEWDHSCEWAEDYDQ